MSRKTINYLAAAMLCCSSMFTLSSCQGLMDAILGTEDKPVTTPTTPTNDAAQLKQGIWTEYDTALLTSGKYTEDELAQMPTVAMWIQGDKASFFTYTAETVSETVEGQISYNKSANTGTITFPNIAGNPLSIQTVNFSMTSDETMQFEFTYEGKKTTATCAWLCENLDNWSSEITDADWKELMAYYDAISAEGPDASIDWSGSATVTVEDVDDEGKTVKKEVTVTDLDEPLVWDDEVASTRANTRIAIFSAITTGLKVFGSLFEEDPNEEINAKLDAVLGKLDNVLQNQQVMNAKLDMINQRLIEIAQRMNKQEIVNIFNNRNEKYYNRLKVQNTKYFDDAYNAYKANKNDPELADYAKAWVGKNEEFANLTWEYVEYLTTVEHTGYGTGMDRIYDGLVFDKYPWEHMGIGDRKSYRAYDLTMIAKCLFMISLYSTYGGLNNVEQKGLYKLYKTHKPQLKAFCEFKVTDPDKFLVCQIPGAHFIMHKQLQEYNYGDTGREAPDPRCYGSDAIYRPNWHAAGSIKISNPAEMKTKLIYKKEMDAMFGYFGSGVEWTKLLIGGHEKAGGAVCAKKQTDSTPILLLYNHENARQNGVSTYVKEKEIDPSVMLAPREWLTILRMYSIAYSAASNESLDIGELTDDHKWKHYTPRQFYAAIVEKRY